MKLKILLKIIPLVSLCSFDVAATHIDTTKSDEVSGLFDMTLEQLLCVKVSVGSRGAERRLNESPVSIEIISSEALESTGFVELGAALSHLLPYFNYQNLAIRDGSDHSLPFALRGMGADQVLVLVNGKRFHPGALTHLSTALGRGANSVDLNNIPIQAVEKVEILKDGAAAQYGSDAIAGVLNIKLKQITEDSASLNLGQTSLGDGEFWSLNMQKHIAKDLTHYLQLTAGLRKSNATIRAGVDSRLQYLDGDPRNDDPATRQQIRMEGANPERMDMYLSLNGEFELEKSIFYGFSNLNYRESNSAGFNRRQRDDRTIRAFYPDGFLPRIEPEILDSSLTLGLKSFAQNDWLWDISNTYGNNSFHYFVTNSANVSMGLASPTEFDAGELKFIQNTLNFDISKNTFSQISVPLKLSLGAEWRYEAYQINAGEESSYIYGGENILDGPNAGGFAAAGAQVFSGFQPQNEQNVSHDSYAVYADVESKPIDDWLLQLAVRYESHNDFGSTTDYKLASLYKINPKWHLKSAISTGFRAPSLGQQYFTSTSIAFLDNELVNVGTFAVNDVVSRSLGAQALKAENSEHLSLGLSFNADNNWSVSLDFFQIEIQDRIELSGNITQNTDVFGQEVADILQANNVLAARFFTNAIDTKTQGADISSQFDFAFDSGSHLSLKASYHYNKTALIGDIKTPNLLTNNGEIIFDRSQVNRITERNPHNNFFMSMNYQAGNWKTTLKTLRYGSVNLIFSTSDTALDQRISSKWLTDLDFKYQFSKAWFVAFGGQNIFDVYPDYDKTQAGSPFYGEGNIFEYSDSSPFGINGATYYLRLNKRF
jgi:iron complex outermembrane receptor protein